ncbi:MAG: hypothetical protein LBO64_08590 [Desulfovibrio sp.]|nr:hypothetical protein [Desulfovibrio sp.]
MCITVNAFRIEGATLLSRQRLSAITAPHEGKCLTLPVINGILRDIILFPIYNAINICYPRFTRRYIWQDQNRLI